MPHENDPVSERAVQDDGGPSLHGEGRATVSVIRPPATAWAGREAAQRMEKRTTGSRKGSESGGSGWAISASSTIARPSTP